MMNGSLSRRWARALMELAVEEKQVDAFGKALTSLQSVFSKAPELLETLADDSIEKSERSAAVEEVAQKMGVSSTFKNFLLMLVKKERIGLIADIDREYQKVSDEILGILRVDVVTPFAPDASVVEKVEKLLSQRLHKQVISRSEVRPDLMGGMVLRVNHTVYNGSVQRELEQLKTNMLKG